MDAEDVKFSLDRARAEDSTNAQKALFAGITDVTVIDPLTVQVTLAEPNGNFLFNMAWGDAVIVAPESIEDIATNPIGTGPFTFTDWVQGDGIELTRNDDYWGPAPAWTSATFRFISDPTAAFAAVMAEDVDAFVGFPAPENLPQFEADPRFQVLVGNHRGRNDPVHQQQDAALRQCHACAKRWPTPLTARRSSTARCSAMARPSARILHRTIPTTSICWPIRNTTRTSPAACLAEAGFADGFTTTLKLPPPSYARRGGEIIASQLRAVGIETEITNLEWAQWLEEVFTNKDFGLTIVSHTEPMDIGIYANPDYYFQYDNPEFQALMETLNATTDPAMRSDLLAQAQTIISEDYVNGYLFELAVATVAKAGLQGLWVNQPTAAVDLTGVSWSN